MTRPYTLGELMDRCEPEPNTGCWLWARSDCPNGYGRLWVDGQMRAAHRVAFAAFTAQPIPDGLFVLHRCDTPACINPDHLFLGTAKQNVEDMVAKRRHLTPRRGEFALVRGKLTYRAA